MRLFILLLIISIAFLPTLTLSDDSRNPAEEVSDIYFARYCISQGKYLIEVGRYLDAIEFFDTAAESTDVKTVVADALLQKASVLATYLDKPNEAVRVWRKILQQYPGTRQAESALYKLGLVYLDANMPEEAVKFFRLYLQRYPQGRFWHSAVFFLSKYTKPLTPPQITPPEPKSPPAKVPSTWIKTPETKPISLPSVEITAVPVIRVRIFKGSSVSIRGNLQVKTGSEIYTTDFITLHSSGNKVLLSGTASKEITIKSLSGPIYLLKSGRWIPYRGFMIARIYKGNLTVVNHINIEQYLYSVVTSESYSEWPVEALKAQAVAARTYALYQSLHRKDWPFDVVDDEGDQAYRGIKVETEKGRSAVQTTDGIVLIWQGRPILSMYTASTGWYVDDPKYIFGFGYPYLQLKRDPFSEREKMGRWKRQISIHELEKGLKNLGLHVFGIYDLIPSEMSPSGRIIKIKILHAGGARIVRTSTTIKKVANLPDILMTIRREGPRFVFYGGGHGHGIGYSQWGSKEMAEQGRNYSEILSFYYPGATLKKLW